VSVNVNKARAWYADQVNGTYKLKLSVLKPFGAKWFVKAFEHVERNAEIDKNGFSATGLTDSIK